MRTQGKGLIVVIYEEHDFKRMLAVITPLRDLFDRVVFFSPHYLPKTPQFTDAVQGIGATYISAYTELGGRSNFIEDYGAECTTCDSVRSLIPWRVLAARLLLKTFLPNSLVYSEVDMLLEQLRDRAFLCTAIDASLIILPEDNVERDSHIWIAISRQLRIPSIVYTTAWILPSRVAQVYSHLEELSISNRKNGLLAWIFRKWVYVTSDGRKMFRLKVHNIFARELTGTAPKHPWYLNTGTSTCVAVDCKVTYEQNLASRVHGRKLFIVGSPDLDSLYEAALAAPRERKRLEKELGIDWSKPVLAVSPPKDYTNKSSELTYEALIGRLIEVLKCWSGEVVIVPHPSIPGDIFKSCPFPVVWGQTPTLVQLCDLYLTAPSSTVKWAIEINKKTIIFDPYGLDMPEMQCIVGIEFIRTFQDLMARLQRGGTKSCVQIDIHERVSSFENLKELIVSQSADPER
ncbi:hypothetical protein [Legionella pneumophila]|uniref:hypothetical protein n=1 Tax=Legionella pneumophila TaxID=446 RepID=UPI000482BE17|nr:hypothetical protein [Legionella pneumophila]STX65067.1 Uncharacterised protein [Legionella pneumophila]HAT2149904.1 hypothetical protein [Legionella pneumophila]HAT2152837.1 hypothetical protein [Legionella pneumophila]HCC0307581.1 hypothetical protein [Legionella pneumophila]